MTRSLVITGFGRTVETEIACSTDLIARSRAFVDESARLRKYCGEDLGFEANATFGEQPAGTIDHSDEIRGLALVLMLRPFVLEREALFVPKYLGAFKRENRSEAAAWASDFIAKSFLLRNVEFELRNDAGKIDLEAQWRAYVYAHYYHPDADKRAKLEETFTAMPIMAPVTFWWGVITKVNIVLQLQAFAAMLAGDEPVFVLNMGGAAPAEGA